MVNLQFGFDLRSSPDGAPHADLVAAMMDMCEWADGLKRVDVRTRVLEHHGSPDGYNPSPITLASALVGRTRNMRFSAVIILPLYHPVRLAEELAILDLVSRGRVSFVFGAGYRQEEFDTFGVELAQRGQLMEEYIEVLKQAWTGEPFEFRGTTVRVTPRPFQQPRPPILMAGSSKVAARRAARIADGFVPTASELLETFRAERVALGKDPGPAPAHTSLATSALVAVSEDPDATWRRIGPHCLHEMQVYASWLKGTPGQVPGFWETNSIDELRGRGRYLVLTPAQCIERAKAMGNTISIQPLVGGYPPDVAWQSLKLIETQVLPHLL
jgi:alkanesulfonate monooxygenase SsuD/methylene tetrahydromethanopterin reductase-like flavin-dependent oxidoreductase (luciferase family)